MGSASCDGAIAALIEGRGAARGSWSRTEALRGSGEKAWRREQRMAAAAAEATGGPASSAGTEARPREAVATASVEVYKGTGERGAAGEGWNVGN